MTYSVIHPDSGAPMHVSCLPFAGPNEWLFCLTAAAQQILTDGLSGSRSPVFMHNKIHRRLLF